MEKKRALVLGGTIPHIGLIKKLKERGYYIILVDYTDNPPAKNYSDIHIKESTLDPEKVLEIAKEYKVDLVISAAIDQANSTACYVGEKLDLPIPYSYETSLDVTKKGRMKRIFKENGIPTADFYVLDHDDGKAPGFDYPFVIKPTDSNSSKGVYKITSENEFHEKIKESLSISRENKAIVEKYIGGQEFEYMCIAVDGVAHILITRDCEALPLDGVELQNLGLSSPGDLCISILNELQIIAQKICDAFHLVNTPFFIQGKCDETGIYVLEFAPRIAGGSTYEVVKYCTGLDYMEALIRSYLHETIDITGIKMNTKLYKSLFLFMKPGIFGSIKGLDECIESGLISIFTPYCISGKEISSSFNSGNKIGSMLVAGDSFDEIDNKLKQIIKKVRVLDINGIDLTNDFIV